MNKHMMMKAGPVLALTLALAACGSDSKTTSPATPTTPTSNVQTVSDLNATAGWVYYDLVNNTVVDVPTADNWQIAFSRYSVKLNQGSEVGTGGKVAGFLAKTPAGFYDTDGNPVTSVFTGATASTDTLPDLTATDLALPATASKWVKDAFNSPLNPAYTGTYPSALNYGWYTYYPTTTAAEAAGLVQHQIKANPENGALLRSAGSNSYARFHLKQISYADPADATSQQTWTFGFDIQPVGVTSFTQTDVEWAVDLPASGAAVCYDIDTQAVADCTGADWDLKLKSGGSTGSLWTNSGTSASGSTSKGGTLGSPFDYLWADLETWTNATRAPGDTADIPSVAWLADGMKNVFTGSNSIGSATFEYDLDGSHKLFPTYRTFLITTDGSKANTSSDTTAGVKVFTLQVTGYYGGTSGTTSGYVSFRYAEKTATP